MNNLSQRAIVLLAVVLVGGTALGAWQFVLIPLEERDETIKRVREELDKKTSERDTMVLDLRLHERAQRQMSLPADQSLALNEYSKLLRSLLLHAKLEVRDFKPGQPDSRNVPMLAGKKPAYTRLTYNIQVRGDLYSLVEFMYGLYRQPLLQQIRKINIQVPQGGSNVRGARADELDVTMTIEALIIDKAENRPTLFSLPPSMGLVAGGMGSTAWIKYKEQGHGSPFNLANSLARDEVSDWKQHATAPEYLKIPGRNIFTGPTPTYAQKEIVAAQQEMDYSRFLKLNEITADTEGYAQASIRNLVLKYDYMVTQSKDGGLGVKVFYYINKTTGDHTITVKKPYDSNTKGKFEFGDAEKGNHKEFVLLRVVSTTDILIQRVDDHAEQEPINTAAAMIFGGSVPALSPGKVYRWHLGQSLHDAVEGKMGVVIDKMTGEEQESFIKAEPLAPHVAQAAMMTKGAFPENLPDPKNKSGKPGWPKRKDWGR